MTNATPDPTAAVWPTALTVPPARDALKVSWDDGLVHTMGAEYLRVFTPSAERTGHGSRQVIGGKAGVLITDVRPVGRYAVRIVFSDGHDTGLYTFADLRKLGRDADANWARYLSELAAVGLSRDREGAAPAP